MIRCVLCRSEFDPEKLGDVLDCPNCHTKDSPMDVSEDVTIKINAHELRILGIWAENYAVHIDNQHLDDAYRTPLKTVINAIVAPLQTQIDEQLNKFVPLTLTNELKQVQEDFHIDVDLYRDGKEEIL